MKIIITEQQFELISRKKINEENRQLKKSLRIIKEENVTKSTIINVDIQPEYENWISFNISDWVNFINRNYRNNNIVFLYNGYDTMGMVNENEYQNWLLELGVKEDVIDGSTFYDKGYAFFRYCMDSGIEDENIVDFIKFMIRHNINDSRYLGSDMWGLYMEETGRDESDVRDLLEESEDMINIPDLMDFISRFNNIVLTGGGINECLKEVEISLMSLDKKYNILHEYTY